MLRRIAAGFLLGWVLVACGDAATPAPAVPPVEKIEASQVVTPEVPAMELNVPKLGIKTTLVELGVDANDNHEVPPVDQPQTAGWYKYSPVPGENGPSIILGHVNGGGQPGVFVDLHTLVPGDIIQVGQFTFSVSEVLAADKDHFPADRVYAESDTPELRLITCGGVFNQESGHYEENVIVFAVAR